MNTTRNRILAGAVTLTLAGFVSGLQAQSSLPPAYYDTTYPGVPASAAPGHYAMPLAGKIYLGFDLGAALQQDITITDGAGDRERVSFDPGVRLDFELGYNFARNWAAELEMGFIVNHL